MDPSTLIPAVGSILATLVTLYVTQKRQNLVDARAERTESKTDQLAMRAAAKDTVDILAIQNKAQASEIDDLRTRIQTVELKRDGCEKELAELAKEHASLLVLVTTLETRIATHEQEAEG